MILLLSAVPISLAQVSDDQMAAFEARVAQVFDQLALSDEQVEAIKPILLAGLEAQKAVFASHGIDFETRTSTDGSRMGLRDARKLGQDLEDVRKDTMAKLGEVLDDEQMAEYQRMQEEARQKMREAARQRR